MRSSARSGIAVPIVLVLLAIAGIGMLAVSHYRGNVARQIDGLVQSSRLVGAAQAALSEAASGRRLNAMLADPAQQEAFVQAFRGGTLSRGVLTPAAIEFLVEPDSVRGALAQDGSLTFGPVRVRPTRYFPGINRGRLRMSVEVEAQGALRSFRRTLAHVYEFALTPTQAGVGLLVARDPVERLYP